MNHLEEILPHEEQTQIYRRAVWLDLLRVASEARDVELVAVLVSELKDISTPLSDIKDACADGIRKGAK